MPSQTKRYKDIAVRYTSDLGRQYVLAQRRYSNPDTPVTSSLQSRELTGVIKPPKIKPFEPRRAIAIYEANNKQGFSERTVQVPFDPSDSRLITQLDEINQIKEVACVRYRGETNNRSLTELV